MNVKSRQKIIIGISVGDLSGIGLEIIFKTFNATTSLFQDCIPILFASKALVSERIDTFGFDTPIHHLSSLSDPLPNVLNVYAVWHETVSVILGKQNHLYGEYAFKSLDAATQALKQQYIHALVTAPINKYTIHSEHFPFHGHTHYLEHQLGGNALMLMVSDNLRVALLTDHIPLAKVAQALTPEMLTKQLQNLEHALIQDFGIENPKIAVLGLNPHAGDQGVIGTEEQTIIAPTLKKLVSKGHQFYGPYVADTFFVNNHSKFDAVLAMYHDQGLIPFKTLSFGKGINVTLGLPFIRTSPDHGTAHDIATKGIAHYDSFHQAVSMAIGNYYNRIKKSPKKIQ